MVKKLNFIASVMAVVILITSFTVFTASAEGVSYSATSVAGKKGDIVAVAVKLSSDVEIWGANVMLAYNSSELQAVKCTKGDVVSSGSLHDTGSSVNYSGTFSAKNGTVFIVEFKILKNSGTSTLKLTSTENINYSGEAFSCSVSDGKVTILDSSAVAGDANEDGKTTAVDARLVLQHVAGISKLSSYQALLVDMNGDGTVTAIDARIILQKVAGLK